MCAFFFLFFAAWPVIVGRVQTAKVARESTQYYGKTKRKSARRAADGYYREKVQKKNVEATGG